jgi:hypothetical protein
MEVSDDPRDSWRGVLESPTHLVDHAVNTGYIDCMVKSIATAVPLKPLPAAAILVRVYLAVVVATLVILGVLSDTAPHQATSHAWGHAIVVSVFAIVLPLRLRSAQTGRRSAIRAVGLISAALFLANVIEALIPGFVPSWMRVEMYVVAALMLGVVLEVIRWAVTNEDR